MPTYLGISRERMYSPGRVDDDAAVLQQVARALRQRGQAVDLLDGDDEAWPTPTNETVVFTMAQGPRALVTVERWVRAGVRVVNSPQAILNCQREATVERLSPLEVGFPETMVIDVAADSLPQLPPWFHDNGAWLKRGDVHATDSDDVVYVPDRHTLQTVLARFGRRGLARAAVQRHVAGRVFKFYGVRDRFFHYVLPPVVAPLEDELVTRFGEVAQRAARALGVEIFGGDCVVSPTGSLHIIDLNDWPSFRACRAAAAAAIADHLQASRIDRGSS